MWQIRGRNTLFTLWRWHGVVQLVPAQDEMSSGTVVATCIGSDYTSELTAGVGGGMGVQAAMRDALRKRGVKVPANLAPWNLFLFVVRPSVSPRRCLSSAR